ncbi:hypothetical protein AB0L40_04230 [Patulibacter sp. NPDC049589]|uniref:hypothetical protein n=1 Tax=Patulibacter sp. NPDC049589 TaxID=3154731 RepID=UPI003412849E
MPLTSETAKLTYGGLDGPAGRFVAPVGVALAIAAGCLALACVALAGRSAPRRVVPALAVSALLVAAGSIVLSVVSEARRLETDTIVFTAAGTGRSVASGGLGPGVFLTVVCSIVAAIVAGAVARRPSRPAPSAAPTGA